jgi:hypothetical protein
VTDREKVAALVEKARVLYQGKVVGHRSCGIALAETFGRPTPAYQALRAGGITGEGTCGSVLAGQLLLGELLGDPDPRGQVTDALREAMVWYQAEIARRLNRGGSPTLVCGDLTGRFPVFHSEQRLDFCTDIVTLVAEVVAQALLRVGAALPDAPIPER